MEIKTNRLPKVVRMVDGRYSIVYWHNDHELVCRLNFVSEQSAQNWLAKYVQVETV